MSADQAKVQRSSAKGRFTRLENLLRNKLQDESATTSVDVIKSMFSDLKEAWKNVDNKHDVYVEELQSTDENAIRENDAWINEMQDRLYEVQNLCSRHEKKCEQKTLIDKVRKSKDVSYGNFKRCSA